MNEKSQGFSHTNSLLQDLKEFSDVARHDLLAAKKLVYNPCGFKCSQLIMEAESTEYGVYAFELNASPLGFVSLKLRLKRLGNL